MGWVLFRVWVGFFMQHKEGGFGLPSFLTEFFIITHNPCVQVGAIEASTYSCLAEHGYIITWDIIDGVRVQSIESLRNLYQGLNRPKDQVKLRLLGF